MKPQIIDRYVYVKGKKISEATSKSNLDGNEILPLAYNDINYNTTVDLISEYVDKVHNYLTTEDYNDLKSQIDSERTNRQEADSELNQSIQDTKSELHSTISNVESELLNDVNDLQELIDNINDTGLANGVTLNTALTITGEKTFTTVPKSTADATEDTDLVNKAYVDGVVKNVYIINVEDLDQGTVDESIINGIKDAYNNDLPIYIKSQRGEFTSVACDISDSKIELLQSESVITRSEIITHLLNTFEIDTNAKTVEKKHVDLEFRKDGEGGAFLADNGDYRVLTKADIGLGNVDNTSDLNKPISNATKEYIDELGFARVSDLPEGLEIGEVTGTAFDGGRGKAVEDVANKLNYAIRSYLLTGGSRNLITYSNNSNDSTVRLDYSLATVSTGERSGNYVDIPSVTTTKAGVMSAADKLKLDAVESTYLPLSGGTMSGSITFLKPTVGNVGDAVLYDKTADKLIIVPTSDTMNEQYPADNYTPIGVVVVPGSHNVYGDGSCGVMSLKPMNCDTPSTGGTSERPMYWGVYGTDISSLPNLNQAPIVGSGSNVGNASSTVTGQDSHSYLPSDKFSAVRCPHDTDAYYYSSSSSYDQAPSPYLTDGSRNPAYYQTTSPSSSNNCLADFDGRGNTNKIIIQRGSKDYSSWRPGTSSESDYPAASCCDMFYTDGTQQGDWYLPAMGELGYIMPPFNRINEAITKMRNAYGSSVSVEVGTGFWYWSSSEYGSNDARFLSAGNGGVYDGGKGDYGYVRAFLRVKPSLVIIIPGKTSNDLLNAAGGTTNINDITNNLPEATDSTAGLMSTEDKTKLDSLSNTIITNGDGTKYLSDNGTYKTIEVPDLSNYLTEDDKTELETEISDLSENVNGQITELQKKDSTIEGEITDLTETVNNINTTVSGLDDKYLPLSGGGLTGNLTILSANASVNISDTTIPSGTVTMYVTENGATLSNTRGDSAGSELILNDYNIQFHKKSGEDYYNILHEGNVSGSKVTTNDVSGGLNITSITQSAYDGLDSKNANTLYIITE